MASKTKMLEFVKALHWKDVRRGLIETPALLRFRDNRGRSWLHLCCGVKVGEKALQPRDSIKTAEVLLAAGLDINEAAFTEGAWRATPLWYAIAHGRNVALARFLLERGSAPNHCMWAAAYNDDAAAIRLLSQHGAALDPAHEDATPLLFAVQWSRFAAAEELLKLGADVDFQGAKKIDGPARHAQEGQRQAPLSNARKVPASRRYPESRRCDGGGHHAPQARPVLPRAGGAARVKRRPLAMACLSLPSACCARAQPWCKIPPRVWTPPRLQGA